MESTKTRIREVHHLSRLQDIKISYGLSGRGLMKGWSCDKTILRPDYESEPLGLKSNLFRRWAWASLSRGCSPQIFAINMPSDIFFFNQYGKKKQREREKNLFCLTLMLVVFTTKTVMHCWCFNKNMQIRSFGLLTTFLRYASQHE